MKERKNFTIDTEYFELLKKMLPNYKVSNFVNEEIQKRVIENVCGANMLHVSCEGLTDVQEKAVFEFVKYYNSQIHMPRPTVEQIQPLMDQFDGSFEQKLYYAIAQFWGNDCFKERQETLKHLTFYIDTWL